VGVNALDASITAVMFRRLSTYAANGGMCARSPTEENDKGGCAVRNFFDAACPLACEPSVIVMAARCNSPALTP